MPNSAPRRPAPLNSAVYSDLLTHAVESSSFSEFAQLVARHAATQLGAQGAAVTRRVEDMLVYESAIGSVSQAAGRSINIHSSVSGSVLLDGKTVLFDPANAGNPGDERTLSDGVGSGIIAPIFVDGVAVGTIGVASSVADPFGPQDVDGLEHLAKFLGISLKLRADRARLQHLERLSTLGTKTAVVAHEVNSPLTWFRLSLHELRATIAPSDDAAVQSLLADLGTGLDRISQTIAAVKAFARDDEVGTFGFVDVTDELRGAIAIARPTLPEGARLIEKLRTDGLALRSMPGQLRQAVTNLLSNAVEATAARGAETQITVYAKAIEGRLMVSVTDNGVGLSPAAEASAFKAFYTTRGKGLGLGLHLVDRFATRQGGQVRVVSASSPTIVEFSLPLKAD